MSGLSHTIAFPDALGTGIIVGLSQPVSAQLEQRIRLWLGEYEAALSRFRADSLVGQMAASEHGGRFVFPAYAEALFALYDRLVEASGGAFDPCVGEDLTRLGYGADWSFALGSGGAEEDETGANGSHPTWRESVQHNGAELITQAPVQMDFGAAGKGFAVDMIAAMLRDALPDAALVIDAGGDLYAHGQPIRVALEDPDNAENAVGVAELAEASLCASAPSRRHWAARASDGAVIQVHHLLNALNGTPVREVKATWTLVPHGASAYPTALADGLATALFVTDAGTLARRFTTQGAPAFQCAAMAADRTAVASVDFPAEFFC